MAPSTRAFAVEPGYPTYSLKMSRYLAVGQHIAQVARQRLAQNDPPVELLDVGCYGGISRRFIEAQPGGEHVRYTGVDLFPHGKEFVYKHEDWTLHQIDLRYGLPGLPSDSFDVVLCEQVLEHLHSIAAAVADLARVLKPGGLMILGVPSFPPGVRWVRQHAVPIADRVLGVKKIRGHVQAFSKRTFLQQIRRHGNLEILRTGGFRIISGGLLRPLEYCRWWWGLNRWIGSMVPSLCTEIQVLATKRVASGPVVLPHPRVAPAAASSSAAGERRAA